MNASGFVALMVEKNSRQYILNIPFGSPYEDAIDACLDMINDIKQMKKDSDAKTAEQKAEVEAAAKKETDNEQEAAS